VADTPIAHSPLSTGFLDEGWNRHESLTADGLTIADVSGITMWRDWSDDAPMGRVTVEQDHTEFSTSPGELTVISDRGMPDTAVDLTHVRASIRVTGSNARDLLMRLTPLDVTADMFPADSAARTLVAGITTEIVHDAPDTFLLITSRSFAGSLWHAIEFAAEEWRH
jgi:heterotetrameric sarcosine oxidase gamma subunit